MIKIVVESGADMPKALAERYGIEVVPMHFAMDGKVYDDGVITPKDVCEYYDKTKTLPTSSGCTPGDFADVFDRIHEKYPEAEILYLAYSACTTCSFQSAQIAAEERDYITSIDTQWISAGQSVIAIHIAKMLEKNPNMTMEEVKAEVEKMKKKVWMGCIPDELTYLQAGGRVSNATAVCGKLLSIHPLIEIKEGKLVATRKLRGSMASLVPKFLEDIFQNKLFNKDEIIFIEGPGLSELIKQKAEEIADKYGFKKVTWFATGSVITVHGGPKAFAVTGIME